ncbi:MAG: helix-turn-helix transcriptional regulator [Chloroflexi bacterium]|nr:helix-turn-helix transcriptional regulator [Chloroflexota bacterium]
MKLQRQSGSENGSASKSVNPFFGDPDEEPSVTLSRFREKFGCSNYRLAELSGVGRPYLHRIENGIKANLSRTIVVKIARGLVRLGVGVLEGHRLLVAAAHLPIFWFARVPSSARIKKTDAK